MKSKIKSVALPPYGVEVPISSGKLKTHEPDQCSGTFCVIHNPSEHHMRDWPINIRLDRFGALAERICLHGVGHPDPDSLAYIESLRDPEDKGYDGVHGCDGDCTVAGYVKSLRQDTPCEHCGKGPIEYHRPSHALNEHRRVSSLVVKKYPWASIAKEISECKALCRSCHMKEDGRMEELQNNTPYQRGFKLLPRECIKCSKLTSVPRKAQCYSCYEKHREGGRHFNHTLSDFCCSV